MNFITVFYFTMDYFFNYFIVNPSESNDYFIIYYLQYYHMFPLLIAHDLIGHGSCTPVHVANG